MNPQDSGADSFNPIMDIDSWLSFFHGRGGGGGGSAMDEQLESELMSIITNSNDTTPPLMQPSSITKQLNFPSYDFPSFINSAEATSVTTMALPRGFMNIPNVNTTVPLGNTTSTTIPSNIIGGNTTGLSRPNAQGNGAVKVKKKRVRASRRVPTTVFRTDTSNFKAMVQHFTGIPPDSSSSSSSSSPSSSCTSTTSTSVNPTSSEPSFTKPLPHPAVCKMPPSTSNNSSTSSTSTAAISISTTSAIAPVSSSVSNHGGHFSFQDISSPLLISNIFNASSSPPSDANDDGSIIDEQITMPAMDAAFFEKLWS